MRENDTKRVRNSLMTPEQHRRQAGLLLQSKNQDARALARHGENLARIIEVRQKQQRPDSEG